MDDLLLWLLIFIAVVFLIPWLIRTMRGGSGTSSNSVGGNAKQQMAEDIKATQTSRVADQVEILDELSSTTQNAGYRQYCELVGTSQAEGGVIAPYSRRQVAFYDIRCYRIDRVGGQQSETLVAHERSIDPFYFKDDSSDTPVYVDLESFGSNVLLINSTNHVEGPNSDFAKAVEKSGSAAKGGSGALAAVGKLAERGSNVLAGLRAGLEGLAPAPQFAYAGVPTSVASFGTQATPCRSNLLLASRRGEKGAPKLSKPASGKVGSSANKGVTINVGGFGMGGIPQGLGSFLGGGYGGFGGMVPGTGMWGSPRPRPNSSSVGDMIVGMALTSILNSMASSSTSSSQQQQLSTNNGFLGYRLVEDIVPLGSPVYCIGEIYRNGTDVYMGRSTAEDYTTSFFATKPEAEVLHSLGA